MYALAERAKRQLCEAEKPSSTGAESVDHDFTIVGLDQEDLGDLRVREVNPTHRRHILQAAVVVIGNHKGNFDFGSGDRFQD